MTQNNFLFGSDPSNMYLRQSTPSVFGPPFQTSLSGLMMTSSAQNLQMNNSWVNPSPTISMDTVTINSSGSMSNRPIGSRPQQQNRGPAYRLQPNSCENPVLPQLSICDLQCLDTGPQAPGINQLDSQPLFHQQHQGEELSSESQAQKHLTSQNQGLQNMWQGFSTTSTAQNNFNGSVPGGGGVSQGHGLFPLLEGMERDEFQVGVTSFQLKQEPQVSVGPDSCFSQSPRENQGNTYTNLLPRPMNNDPSLDLRRHDTSGIMQPLTNLQSPLANNGLAPEVHYATLADWIKASQQND